MLGLVVVAAVLGADTYEVCRLVIAENFVDSKTQLAEWNLYTGYPAAEVESGTDPAANRITGAYSTDASCPGSPTSFPPPSAPNDLDTATNFECNTNPSLTGAIELRHVFGGSFTPSSYRIVTASDSPNSDPKSWTVECSLTVASIAWIVLDTVTDFTQVTARGTSYGYFPLPTKYIAGTIYRTEGPNNNACPDGTAAPTSGECDVIARNIMQKKSSTTEFAELLLLQQAMLRSSVMGATGMAESTATSASEAAMPVGCYMKVPTSTTAATNGQMFFNTHASGAEAATGAKVCCTGACSQLDAYGDPHLTFAHGGYAHFRGIDHGIFNFLSAPNVSFNVETEDNLYNTAFSSRTINGSFLIEATWVVRTVSNKTVYIDYNARLPDRAFVRVGSPTSPRSLVAAKGWLPAYPPDEKTGIYLHGDARRKKTGRGSVYHILSEDRVFKLDDVTVAMPKTKKLMVETAGWAFTVKQHVWYPHHLHPRLSINIRPKYDVEAPSGVAPHGLIGQSWDRDQLAISGAVDNYYSVPKGAVFTTTAQAEGAIEGTYMDYLLSSPFATAFRYSRFDATSPMPPRNVSALTGSRSVRKSGEVGGAASVARPVSRSSARGLKKASRSD